MWIKAIYTSTCHLIYPKNEQIILYCLFNVVKIFDYLFHWKIYKIDHDIGLWACFCLIFMNEIEIMLEKDYELKSNNKR